jgi:hypothetical protein
VYNNHQGNQFDDDYSASNSGDAYYYYKTDGTKGKIEDDRKVEKERK